MGQNVSFDGALKFTKLSVYLARTWPPPTTASKWETNKYHVSWCVSFLSILCLFVPLLLSISEYSDDPLAVTHSATFVGSTSNLMIKMIVYRIHMEQTQPLIQKMEIFLKNAQPHEIIVCRRYINRYANFHLFISFLNYLTAVVVISMPMFVENQALPTGAVYPFSTDNGIVRFIAYLHQTLAGFQCSSGVTIDCQAALILWFAGARLEILADEVKHIKDLQDLTILVHKHRKLIDYAVDGSSTMAYVAFASSIASGVTAIMSSLQLFGNQPLSVKMQFGPVALIATMNLLICAWPADNLINACERLERAVYDISWVDMSVNMMKNILIFLQRCQRPVTVSIGGFLPGLSLSYYTSFLSAIFSYFTTLRLVLADKEK